MHSHEYMKFFSFYVARYYNISANKNLLTPKIEQENSDICSPGILSSPKIFVSRRSHERNGIFKYPP